MWLQVPSKTQEQSLNSNNSYCQIIPQQITYNPIQTINIVKMNSQEFERNFISGKYYGEINTIISMVLSDMGVILLTDDMEIHYLQRKDNHIIHSESIQLSQNYFHQKTQMFIFNNSNLLVFVENTYFNISLSHNESQYFGTIQQNSINIEAGSIREIFTLSQKNYNYIYISLYNETVFIANQYLQVIYRFPQQIKQLQIIKQSEFTHTITILVGDKIQQLVIYSNGQLESQYNNTFAQFEQNNIHLFGQNDNYLIVGIKQQSNRFVIITYQMINSLWIQLNTKFWSYQINSIHIIDEIALLVFEQTTQIFRYKLNQTIINKQNFMNQDSFQVLGIKKLILGQMELQQSVQQIVYAYTRNDFILLNYTQSLMNLQCYCENKENSGSVLLYLNLSSTQNQIDTIQTKYFFHIDFTYSVITKAAEAQLSIAIICVLLITLLFGYLILKEFKRYRLYLQRNKRMPEILTMNTQQMTIPNNQNMDQTINESQIQLKSE